MMKQTQTNKTLLIVIVLMTLFFQTTPAIARSDGFMQREIKAKIAQTKVLRGTQIEVRVVQRLVVLTGQVRLFEQKLIGGRIAWTAAGVYEVENDILVVPTMPVSDNSIDLKIRKIIQADKRFIAAAVELSVNNGEVRLSGKFANLHDPSRLKHRVAEIEGVLDIKMNAEFNV